MGSRVLTACSFRSKSIPQQVFHRCRSAEALDYSVYPRCTSLRRFYGFSPFCYFVESITYVESIPPRGSTPTPGTSLPARRARLSARSLQGQSHAMEHCSLNSPLFGDKIGSIVFPDQW